MSRIIDPLPVNPKQFSSIIQFASKITEVEFINERLLPESFAEFLAKNKIHFKKIINSAVNSDKKNFTDALINAMDEYLLGTKVKISKTATESEIKSISYNLSAERYISVLFKDFVKENSVINQDMAKIKFQKKCIDQGYASLTNS